GGERLPRMTEWTLLRERRAQPVREAAVNLSIHDHGIYQLAAILDDDVAQNFHVSGFRIDRYQRRMRGVAEGSAAERRFVAGRGLETAGIDVTREILRPQVPGARDLRQTDGPLRADSLAVPDEDLRGIGLQQPSSDARRALGVDPAGGRPRAASHHHRARAPGAG